jgi:lysophospholipase L1-like esterase
MRLAARLGDGYAVIEEGFNGRTTVFDDPVEGGYKSGLAYLPPCLMSHNPLDLVVLMLGTNDTKERFSMNAYTIAQCVGELVDCVRRYGQGPDGRAPKVLVLSPIEVGDWVMDTIMGPIFGPNAAERSRGLASHIALVAREKQCAFLDAAIVAKPAPEDAVHLTREGHLALAEAVYRAILGMGETEYVKL